MTVTVVVLTLLLVVAAGAAAFQWRRATLAVRANASVAGPSNADGSAITVPRLRRALDAIDAGVVVTDEGGAVVYRNKPGGRYVGARHGDALVESAIAEALSSAGRGEPVTRSVELFGPPRRSLSLRAVPLDDDAVSGAICIVLDETERRHLDEVRRDFVANISHELRTPIGGIALLAETLVDEDDPATVVRLARRVHTESHRVSRMIEDLLDLTRIEAGEPLAREMIPVAALLADAVARAESLAARRDIDVEISVDQSGLAVAGDRPQLTTAVFNLIENAVKYSPVGETVVVVGRSGEGTVELSVADMGDGIPTLDLDRIFERFYRVDQARARDTGGTGLGLAIVRHVASNHGGSVEVRSLEGAGSTFTLRIPTGESESA